MDYANLLDRLKKETYWLGSGQPYSHDVHPVICDEAVTAITDLMAHCKSLETRLETAEKMVKEYQDVIVPGYRERAEKAEKVLGRVRRVLYDPLIILETQGGKENLRPVKSTSRQDVYKTVLMAQKAAGITGRWFPDWAKED